MSGDVRALALRIRSDEGLKTSPLESQLWWPNFVINLFDATKHSTGLGKTVSAIWGDCASALCAHALVRHKCTLPDRL